MSKYQVKIAKIEAVLAEPRANLGDISVYTAYKPKSKKVQLVNVNNGTREGPRGRLDQYKRSKAQEVP